MKNRIYMDHAATTALSPEVLEEMMPFLTEAYGNPSAVYATGRETRRALEKARQRAAEAIGARPQEIFFTSGGSESDAWALTGTALAQRSRGNHIITTAVEHHAVLNTCGWLEKTGFRVTYLPVDAKGRVNPDEAAAAMDDPETVLVSVMAANNEIGTLEPVAEIGAEAKKRGIPFHTDAVQAMGAVPVDAEAWQADLISLSAHKFHGPKGTGLLYVRQGTRLEPLIRGGAQERGLRAGTENVAGIVGMGKAMETAASGIRERAARTAELRDRLIRGVLDSVPGAALNGDPEKRLPGNAHFTFPDVSGEALLLRLDLAGIAASSGSACTSGSVEPSHVLAAIGLDPAAAGSSLRLTLGEENTEAEVDETVRTLAAVVRDLRQGQEKWASA